MKRYANYLSFHLFLIVIVTSFLSSCGNMATKKQIDANIIKTKDENRQDSIKKQEELIVFGSMRFGMNLLEFQNSKVDFIEKCKDYHDNDKKYYDLKIGDYTFRYIDGYFYKEKLYYVKISGKSIGYKVYDNNMKIEYDGLFNVLKNKYGNPTSDIGFPSWASISDGERSGTADWFIGDKTIIMSMECKDNSYMLNLIVHQPSISKLIEEEEDVKKQNAIKKGVDVL